LQLRPIHSVEAETELQTKMTYGLNWIFQSVTDKIKRRLFAGYLQLS